MIIINSRKNVKLRLFEDVFNRYLSVRQLGIRLTYKGSEKFISTTLHIT
jgi:hypothetical protein